MQTAQDIMTRDVITVTPDTDITQATKILLENRINGLPVGFLVDTGASSVAMNAGEARRLGIDFRVDGDSTYVSTASGVARAYRVRLDRVKVGAIELRNVEALVVDGSSPTEVLLGMSFLQRLELMNQGDHLTLRRKY